MTDDDFDQLNLSYSNLHDLLDAQGHDDDCVWRCVRNDCNLDHGCEKCADDEEDMR